MSLSQPHFTARRPPPSRPRAAFVTPALHRALISTAPVAPSTPTCLTPSTFTAPYRLSTRHVSHAARRTPLATPAPAPITLNSNSASPPPPSSSAPLQSSPSNSTSTSSSSSSSSSSAPKAKQKRFAIAGVIFLVVTYIWAIILIIPMLLAHPFILAFDRGSRRFHDFIAMAWMRWSCFTVNVTPKVINAHKIPPHSKSVVYVANHTSYLDIFVFAYLFRRIKYVSKAEIFRIPIVGWAMQMAGNIALVRSSAKGQMQAYRQMVSTIRNGLSLVVFPEGTRSKTGVMKRFKPGAFRAAKQNNVDIVPITILGTRNVMPASALVPLHYPRPTEPIAIVVHDAIDSQKFEIPQLAEEAFRAIDSGLPEHLRTWDDNGNKRRIDQTPQAP